MRYSRQVKRTMSRKSIVFSKMNAYRHRMAMSSDKRRWVMIADANQTISFTRSKYCRVANITSTLHRPRLPTHTTTTTTYGGGGGWFYFYALQLHIAALWGNGKELFTLTKICKYFKCCMNYHTKSFSSLILLEIIHTYFYQSRQWRYWSVRGQMSMLKTILLKWPHCTVRSGIYNSMLCWTHQASGIFQAFRHFNDASIYLPSLSY